MRQKHALVSGLIALLAGGGAVAASFYDAAPVTCALFPPPVVTVHYQSAPVRYDFTKSIAELSSIKSDTANPYGPGAHTYTEGLRADRPIIETRSSEKVTTYPVQGLFCIGYNTVDVTVQLKPTIYIAKRWPPGACRDAIMGHEQKHIAVDHEVMADFVKRVKERVMAATRDVGTLGPLRLEDQESTEAYLTGAIRTAINAEADHLHAVITERQSHVDTLPEYERVSRICGAGRR
jgi:hypothetical protein